MKVILLLTILYLLNIPLHSAVHSAPLTVMNFNTMCDLCGNRENYGSFRKRLVSMTDTINRHRPDLVSLQEFSNIRQVMKVVRKLQDSYFVLYANGKILNYTDPVLLVSKKRFNVKANGGFWLGPNPKFPIGWKLAIPRRLHWAHIFDKTRNEEFMFVGTHFDNSAANKIPSASVANNFFEKHTLPIIFAGDSNIKTTSDGYAQLLGNNMEDTFPGLEQVTFHANGPYSIHDGCNQSKGAIFPECRIDHVLISKNAPWSINSWAVDVFRYQGKIGFVSDHRAVIVTLQ